MLLCRTHQDDDDLLHDILELEHIELEQQWLFGTCNRSLKPPSGSEHCLPATTARKLTNDANHSRSWTDTPHPRPTSTRQAVVCSQQEVPRRKQTMPPGLQELEVVPDVTLKGHVILFFKQAPPHVENFGDSKDLTTKEREDLKPKMSAGPMGKPKDKNEAEAESEGKPKDEDKSEAQAKEKQMNSQPGAARTYSEAERLKVNPTAEETAPKCSKKGKKNEEDEETAQGQKATLKEEGEVAED
ncbi:uncharacterized protein LOC142774520 [Rhipicephalus microplus]|uniref:uncharacterized protein LOC142774520 n=1 Tax=Rhipicephalus microplus TaxID=6941 RepID=UPI003F6A6A55